MTTTTAAMASVTQAVVLLFCASLSFFSLVESTSLKLPSHGVFGRFWCVTKIVFRDMSNLPSNDLFSVTVARK